MYFMFLGRCDEGICCLGINKKFCKCEVFIVSCDFYIESFWFFFVFVVNDYF